MPQNFLTCDRDQPLLLPPDLREWLPDEHLAFFVLETTSELELSAFFTDYRADGHGRAAHDPEMMVAVLLYAYAVGVRSSREIERRCSEDVAFRVLAANRSPDHATFARFRARHQDALAGLFGQLLGLCAEAGIVSGELVALDSTKIKANASGQLNRSYRQIAEEILADAASTDEREDALHGDRRGDELIPELRDPDARKAWIKERLTAGKDAEATASARPERLTEAKRRLQAEHAERLEAEDEHRAWRAAREAELAAEGKKIAGRRPSKEPAAEPAGRINTTDLDSRPVKTHRGFIQGYSAQAVATKEQVIVSCDLVASSADGGQLEPMIAAAQANLEAVGATRPRQVLADAGYWSKAQIADLERRGIEALVPPDGHVRDKPPPKAKRAGPYAEMREKLRSERGRKLYRRRQQIVEPIFAQVKVNRGIDRFQRRGLAACGAELRLIAATHNLLKLWRAAPGPA